MAPSDGGRKITKSRSGRSENRSWTLITRQNERIGAEEGTLAEETGYSTVIVVFEEVRESQV
jgi:hypothetical protein